jgi:hypothetical protein
MAKIEQPARTVEVCDICRREKPLEECKVCKRKYCLSCAGHFMLAGIQPDVCEKCAIRSDVKAIIEKYRKQFIPVLRRRDAALERLHIKPPK